ncbi:Uma2 family endonuclease [Nostoc sp. FACHB-152]|uniref:Uma2 family endonuclease n=1 Tax=unclassified Nostoc TaxID=2593658 RepID=UPI00168722FE|nr:MULTISPECIES: Uma2 family endonuclease [unclassified Nostoc]MBD2446165.1 Uma2 family endonuclease [Nostoc sp. FACHB-152]MBD2467397.1 Uma2 family endonuclease [Nostoc sp. FACHB-145]
MTQALRKITTFQEFVDWKPENGRYELHDGVIIEIPQPLGGHEEVTGFLSRKLTVEFDRLNLPFFIPNQALVKPSEDESGYLPDVLILNQTNLINEPLWQKSSTVIQAASIPLVIEVVSTNWRDDYFTKLGQYEEIGIPEYWIVDYLALGGRKFIGNPKQPTISVNFLVDGEYQVNQFKSNERIISPTFPELNLTAEQVFQSGNQDRGNRGAGEQGSRGE